MDETREIPSQRTQQLPRTVVIRSTRRVVIAILGGILIVLGIAAALVPGVPGVVLVLLGLTILSWEFLWAKRARFRLKQYWKDLKGRRRKR